MKTDRHPHATQTSRSWDASPEMKAHVYTKIKLKRAQRLP